ncbi:ATP-binding protein [Caldimonas sp. KR1-144]|uniref:PAS domain-containing hybrid sensor histidine kinase/response regulator n=1 Tax=Caldimonas sp. KR1-144 TaxID=3400911 RepID=UPI003C08F679
MPEFLRATPEEMNAILENAAVGILFTSDRGIRLCNARAAEIFGFSSPDELVGQTALVVYPDRESFERLGREAAAKLDAGLPFDADWQMRKRDGSTLWCHLHGKAVAGPGRGTVWIVDDITASRGARLQLQATTSEMAGIMDNAPVGIVFTHDRRITRYNARFAEMFGFTADSGIGQPARVLLRSDEEYEELGRRAAPLLSTGRPYQCEMFARRQDGSDFWTSMIAYVQNTADPTQATIWIVEDRTEFKRAEELLRRANAELAAARDRAEVANRAKSDFLARMSHELRTPLNGILGYAQILDLDASLSERQRMGVKVIGQAGHHLLTLIDDILDLSRIEAGRLDLAPQPVDLRAFLRVVADIVRVRADQKGLLFELVFPSWLPRTVLADERRLRQVLLNLLGNAIKFTEHGSVRLEISLLASDAERAHVGIAVEDSGVGIAPEHLQRIFEPFEQAGQASHRAQGSGLGLAISRSLAHMMGGDISVTSRPGQGSRFSLDVWLPVVDAPGTVQAAPRRIRGYHGPRRRVLVVDDVINNRALMVDYLLPLGFEVHQAADGVQGLDRARAVAPDLIVMDNTMPVLDGLEATRRLRAGDDTRHVPIVCVSASATQASRQRSLEAGASAFLSKPVDLRELADEIGRLLGLDWIYEPAATP